MASGLEITSSVSTSIEKASGQSVRLDCQFTLASEDSGPLDIEWSLKASDRQKEDRVVRTVQIQETMFVCHHIPSK